MNMFGMTFGGRTAFWSLAGAVALTACLTPPSARAEEPKKPNIVVILADDMGWGDVGWHGSQIATPNLDRLAASGARLEQFYVQPVCSPTRAAFMTGRYPMRHGLQVGVVRPWAQYGLPLDERTLPQALKEAGYETAIAGKWHLGHFRPEYLPTRRGFDHQYGHYNGALDYNTHVRDDGHDWHRDDKENHDKGYSTHLLAGEAVRVIAEHDVARPLFLYVPFNGVHAPHQVPDRYKEPYSTLAEPRRTYAGMLAAVDEAVGQIAGAIAKKGIGDHTLIVFSSDNGGPNPGRVTSNGPLRGAKATLFEGGVRVAAFANWPGRIKPGSVVNAPLHIVDLYPTFLKLAGASTDQSLPLDGRDAWSAIVEGKASPHDAILLNATQTNGAIRVGDWKLIVGRPGGPGEAEADGAPAPAVPADAGRVLLFNLAEDPYEKRDLAASQPAKVAELRARYDALAAQAVPPRAAPKPPGFRSPRVWGQSD
ncbi:arylsulfatase B [Paludisphaera mucosa]|uniref:Arylsulfatase n=1 Tax=Paludisphaera mucosa TaxID=3030827 RepID=A0ABT6F8M1_9BACT|nr:arylsulfatase [Paludisphaera mucosa]MDG3003836.1 arylsulfatase [Paludisphaera mucosa]